MLRQFYKIYRGLFEWRPPMQMHPGDLATSKIRRLGVLPSPGKYMKPSSKQPLVLSKLNQPKIKLGQLLHVRFQSFRYKHSFFFLILAGIINHTFVSLN